MEEERGLTYRVEYVPHGWGRQTLRSAFHPDDTQYLEVRSLTPDVTNYDGTGYQVATIYFSLSTQREPRLRDDDSDLVLDKNFLGFTPLNETVADPEADLVAVTGLAGHAFGSWAHTRRRMWLRDYLPCDLQLKVRVLIYGYNSQVEGNDTPTSILADHGNKFANDLLRIRTNATCGLRPLILVGHSLGGLIIKQALADLAPGLRDMLPVRRIFFLGVPHGGLDQVALAEIVRGRPSQELVNELRRNSPTLRGLAGRFKANCSDLIVHTYYEDRMTKTVVQSSDGKLGRSGPPVMMVDETSALLHHPWEVSAVSVNGNHSEIAKLKRGQGEIYTDIKAHIEDALRDIEHPHTLLPGSQRARSVSPWRFNTSQSTSALATLELSPPTPISSAPARTVKPIHDAENCTEEWCMGQCMGPAVTYADHAESCTSAPCLGGKTCKEATAEPSTDLVPVSPSTSMQMAQTPSKSAGLGDMAAHGQSPKHADYCRESWCLGGSHCAVTNGAFLANAGEPLSRPSGSNHKSLAASVGSHGLMYHRLFPDMPTQSRPEARLHENRSHAYRGAEDKEPGKLLPVPKSPVHQVVSGRPAALTGAGGGEAAPSVIEHKPERKSADDPSSESFEGMLSRLRGERSDPKVRLEAPTTSGIGRSKNLPVSTQEPAARASLGVSTGSDSPTVAADIAPRSGAKGDVVHQQDGLQADSQRPVLSSGAHIAGDPSVQQTHMASSEARRAASRAARARGQQRHRQNMAQQQRAQLRILMDKIEDEDGRSEGPVLASGSTESPAAASKAAPPLPPRLTGTSSTTPVTATLPPPERLSHHEVELGVGWRGVAKGIIKALLQERTPSESAPEPPPTEKPSSVLPATRAALGDAVKALSTSPPYISPAPRSTSPPAPKPAAPLSTSTPASWDLNQLSAPKADDPSSGLPVAGSSPASRRSQRRRPR
ncbi:hypothetical protein LTR53_011243 [Teratosphaeriaceae sp. CCFEE 6253]|nr:hypothetical protein LTR53_011243 [Teratosphaeriaceae sp. CCFEE 6253]